MCFDLLGCTSDHVRRNMATFWRWAKAINFRGYPFLGNVYYQPSFRAYTLKEYEEYHGKTADTEGNVGICYPFD